VSYPSEPCPNCHGKGYRSLPEAGIRLRRIRTHYGVRARALARALGVSEQRVCDYERGRRLTPVKIAEQWEPTCQRLSRRTELPEPPREASEPDPMTPQPRQLVADESMSAPREPPPQPWIPRLLREQGWTVVDGQVTRPSDEGSVRRRR